ncbi:MAG: hypothetical protein JEY91_18100, partial [Spirochaetaceae bacterium]|nr:hypothetical protein [Spirochaetaceae bacterium]
MNRLKKNSPANRIAADKLGIDFKDVQTFLQERKILTQIERICESGNIATEIISNMLNYARKDNVRTNVDLGLLMEKTLHIAMNDQNFK